MIIATHLWQSTLCLGVAALLCAALWHAPARTRQRIWLCASLKFLVPFSAIAAAGRQAATWVPALMPSGGSAAPGWLDRSLAMWNLDVVGGAAAGGFGLHPGTSTALGLVTIWATGAAALVAWRWRQWRAVSALARAATPLVAGREADALRDVRRRPSRPQRIVLGQCPSAIEPGVYGIFRPRLLWPAGLSARLGDAELRAVLTHEAVHVDRRDNLAAALQVVVETVFWFHPGVWWLGARLIDERERACDEEVLEMGTDPRSYAAGILEVCGFCLRAPTVFLAGVGGSDLARRIERIVRHATPAAPAPAVRVLLAAALVATLAAPVATGVLDARHGDTRTRDQAVVHGKEDGVTQPKVVKEVKPSYTAAAVKAKIQGSIGLEAVVLESGTVGDVTVVRSLDTEHGLDDEAVKALKQWQFEPGRKDGKAVRVRVEVEMTFSLGK